MEFGTAQITQPNFYRPFVKILYDILQWLDFLKIPADKNHIPPRQSVGTKLENHLKTDFVKNSYKSTSVGNQNKT